MLDDKTPTNSVAIGGKNRIRTDQATLVSVLVFGFLLGGGLVSIKADISSQTKDIDVIRQNQKLLMDTVFFTPSASKTKKD